jgi:hypothetical protein
MNLAKAFKQLSVLTLFTSLGSTAVHAHPGHVAGETLHGLLHIEHIIPLVAAGAIALAVYTLRGK